MFFQHFPLISSAIFKNLGTTEKLTKPGKTEKLDIDSVFLKFVERGIPGKILLGFLLFFRVFPFAFYIYVILGVFVLK